MNGPPGPVSRWPLALWGTFFGAFFLVSIAAVSLMYEQWAERERLIFPPAGEARPYGGPLAVLPITLTESLDRPEESIFPPAGEARPYGGRKRLFWAGLAVACFHPLYNFSIRFWSA